MMPTQRTIFDSPLPDPDLVRVSHNIADLITEFCRHIACTRNGQFHMAQLHDYIRNTTGIAPASPDRVLRMLRQQGRVRYVVLDRSKSLYEVLEVEK